MPAYHDEMMGRALRLARKGVGRTSPNPAVGCVIVRKREVVGEGWHRRAGTPHAEIHALKAAGGDARGSDVYVTLEPCSHFGQTPPCAEALIRAGVARVFIGMQDPNPLVSGLGIAALSAAGIETIVGIRENECRRINEPFLKHVTTGLPFVIWKAAMTLDGWTATADGDSRWITNEKSRRYVHLLRSQVDAVMVGVETVLSDNPQLNVRLGRKLKDPVRIVVDSRLRTPPEASIFSVESGARTLIATASSDSRKIKLYRDLGAEVMSCGERSGRVDLQDLMMRLGNWGVQSVLLEGGGVLAGEMLRHRLIDKFILFTAPKILGGEGRPVFAGPGAERMSDALSLTEIEVRRFGDDVMIQGYPERKCSRDS
jgi:diaminohydroxyphosphoribosylaminopyrimidine deaminase / 5-amino-6-(5-phosphoribosylamino)uracil reductase